MDSEKLWPLLRDAQPHTVGYTEPSAPQSAATTPRVQFQGKDEKGQAAKVQLDWVQVDGKWYVETYALTPGADDMVTEVEIRDGLAEVRERFDRAIEDYVDLMLECEAEVARWEWTSSNRYELQPLYFERHRCKPGRVLKQEPPNKNGVWQYGFDNQERVVVERQGVEFEGRFYETFLRHEDDTVWSVLYDYHRPKKPINVTRYRFEDGRAVSQETFAQFGCGREEYEYENRRLTRIHDWHQEHGQGPTISRYDVGYDETGQIASIHVTYPEGDRFSPEPHTSVVYQRPVKGQTIAALTAWIKQRLILRIPEMIAAAGIEEPAYCVTLAYHPEPGVSVVPSVGVGLEAERESWVRTEGKDACDLIWNPAEFTHYCTTALTLADDDLERACDLLGQQLGARGTWAPARRMFNEVAAELLRVDWSGRLNITPDFVVYAVDLELADLKRNLKASIPPERLKELKRSGYL